MNSVRRTASGWLQIVGSAIQPLRIGIDVHAEFSSGAAPQVVAYATLKSLISTPTLRTWPPTVVRVGRSHLVKALRSFVRFAGDRGWCRKHLAEVIEGPRVYSDESLPMGPPWPDVERLLKSVDTNRPRDVRGRAILMLLAIYGLRAGEVRKLDWTMLIGSTTSYM